MKKRNLFLTLGLSLTLGVGVAAGLGASRVEAKEVDAAVPEKIYLDLGICNYWRNKDNAVIRAYFFNNDDDKGTAWPGLAMNAVSGYSGLYEVTPENYSHVIFNVNGFGGDCQTANLDTNSSTNLFQITGRDGENKGTGSWSVYSEKTVYVLDFYGNGLNVRHNLHAWNETYKSDDVKTSTNWPGLSMTKVDGTNDIWSVNVYSGIEKLMINNKNGDDGYTTETLDYSSNTFVLKAFNSTPTLVSLNAAKFVDKYMHFADVSTSTTTDTGACKGANGYYAKARDAYDLLDPADKEYVNGDSLVTKRLGDWKNAYDNDNASPVFSITNTNNNENSIIILLITIATVTLISGGFLLLKKKRISE